MSRLVKLEKMLERGLDRLRHPETSRELVEAIPDVLDEIEDRLEPSGGRGRVFPYDRVLVAFRVASADRPVAIGTGRRGAGGWRVPGGSPTSCRCGSRWW